MAPPRAEDCWATGSDVDDATGPNTPVLTGITMTPASTLAYTWPQCSAACMAHYQPYGAVHVDTPIYFSWTGEAKLDGTCSCGTAASGVSVTAMPGVTTTGTSTVGRACAYQTGRVYFNGIEVAKEVVLGSKLSEFGHVGASEPWGEEALHGFTLGAAARNHPATAPLWKGTIDELAIWRRTLSPDDIKTMHRSVMGTGQIIGQWAGVALPPSPAPPILDARITCCDKSQNKFYATKWREYVGQWVTAHSNGDWTSNNAAVKWVSTLGYGQQCCRHGGSFGKCNGGWVHEVGGFECHTVRNCIANGCAAVDSGEFAGASPPAPAGSAYNADHSAYVRVALNTEVVATCPHPNMFKHSIRGGCAPARLCGDETLPTPARSMSTAEWYDYCFARCDAAGATLAQITTHLTHRGGRTCECKPASCAASVYRSTTAVGIYVPQYTSLYQRYLSDPNAGRRMHAVDALQATTCYGFSVDTTTKTCTFYGSGYPTTVTTGVESGIAVFWKTQWNTLRTPASPALASAEGTITPTPQVTTLAGSGELEATLRRRLDVKRQNHVRRGTYERGNTHGQYRHGRGGHCLQRPIQIYFVHPHFRQCRSLPNR